MNPSFFLSNHSIWFICTYILSKRNFICVILDSQAELVTKVLGDAQISSFQTCMVNITHAEILMLFQSCNKSGFINRED